MRNSGGGIFIPPIDVSHIVKPRQQSKEEIEMLKLLMESSGDEAMGEGGERFGYYEKGTMEDDFVTKLGGKVHLPSHVTCALSHASLRWLSMPRMNSTICARTWRQLSESLHRA